MPYYALEFVGLGVGLTLAVILILAADRVMEWLIPCRLPDVEPVRLTWTGEWVKGGGR